MKLGQLLLHRGIIDRDQLRTALRRQAELQVPLGEILLRMGIVARTQVTEAMRSQPHASIDEISLRRVPRETVQVLPSDLREKLGCVPIIDSLEVLILAMVDPADVAGIARVRDLVDKPVAAVAGPPEVIAEINAGRRSGRADAPSPAVVRRTA